MAGLNELLTYSSIVGHLIPVFDGGPRCHLSSCASSAPSDPATPTSSIDTWTSSSPPDSSPTFTSTTLPLPIIISIPSPSPTSTQIIVPIPSPSPISTQNVQLTSPLVNIDSLASSSEPESITTTILSTNGIEVVTLTSVVENPAMLHYAGDDNNDSGSFTSNRTAVIGVFTAVGVIVLVLFLILVLYIFRKRQARKRSEKDHATATAGARRFLDDEDELGNEKGWWHGSSGITLSGIQPVYYNPGPLDFSRPNVGVAHPYASALPTPNRMAPPVDTYSNYQSSIRTPPSYGPPSADRNTTNAQPPPSVAEGNMSPFGFDHEPQPHGQSTSPSPVRSQETSGGGAHPYASPRRHTVYELLAEDVLAQHSPHHCPPVQRSPAEIPGIETVAREHSPAHLTITPVMHNSPAIATSDLFAGGSRSGSADEEQWYDDTDSESHTESGKSGLAPLPPSELQAPVGQPRFSGLFGPSTAWAARNSVDAGTICEEDQERFGSNGRFLTVANA